MNDPDVYSQAQVETLIGLRQSMQERVTVVDIMSLMNDPGGDAVWRRIAQENYPLDAWMARRGPLPPDARLACIYYDFRRAMKRMPLYEQGVIALVVMGFSKTEIATLFSTNTREVQRVLSGRVRRDGEGKIVRNDLGRPIYNDGAVTQLAKGMNGHASV